jgi:hypothetical protein
MNRSHKVRIYDPETKQVTEIPALELAPGMLKVEEPELGKVFVPINSPVSEPRLRHALPIGFEAAVRAVHECIEQPANTADQFVEVLRYCEEPVQILMAWMKVVAVSYQIYRVGDTVAVRREIMEFAFLSFNNCVHSLQTFDFTHISRSRARTILARMESIG